MRRILFGFCILFFVPIIVIATPNDDILALINSERVSLGAQPLTFHQFINNAAQLHSEDMLANDYFSHTSLDGRTMLDRIQNAGFFGSLYGENIAWHTGNPDATRVFNGWKNSSGHYANMVNHQFNFAGIGIATGYWDYGGYSNLYSTVYTLDLGKQTMVCNNSDVRQCGISNIGKCSFGNQTCISGTWGTCEGAVNPIQEVCTNGEDDDCDGTIDEYCNCTSNYSLSCYNNDVYWFDSCGSREIKKEECGVSGCFNAACRVCLSHNYLSCYSGDSYWYNSCSIRETKNEDCPNGCDNGICNPPICGDLDEDGAADVLCGGTDCDDQNPQVYPASIEICNGKDEDCDFISDEECIDNLIIITPRNSDEFGTRRVDIILNVTHLKDSVSYKTTGSYRSFCTNNKDCEKTLLLPNGDVNIYFKLSDYFGINHSDTLSIFIDSINPRIIRQSPQNRMYSNGSFSVTYSENDLQEIDLYLALPGSDQFFLAKSNMGCESGNNKECKIDYDLSLYNPQTIKYYFEISDKINSIDGREYTIIVDTIKPKFTSLSFTKTSNISERYKLEVQLDEQAKMSYLISGEDSIRSLCSSCSTLNKNFYFRQKPDYIDIFAQDKAGNINSNRIVIV